MRCLPLPTAEQFGAFTTEQAQRAGWSRQALSRAAAAGVLERFTRGVYLQPSGTDDHIDRARQLACSRAAAAALAVEGAVVSHRSAALLAGLPVLTMPSRPCITIGPPGNGDTLAAHLHRARLVDDDVVTARAVRRTGLARTIVDIAREFGVDEAVVVADAALARQLTSRAALDRQVESQSHWPGIASARVAARRCSPLSESPLESMSRLRLSEDGVPDPDLQVELADAHGRFVARVDFYWDEFGVVGEADGMAKYVTPDVLRAEKVRQERLEECGLTVVRWGWQDLTDGALRRRLLTAFARAQAYGTADRQWRLLRSARA